LRDRAEVGAPNYSSDMLNTGCALGGVRTIRNLDGDYVAFCADCGWSSDPQQEKSGAASVGKVHATSHQQPAQEASSQR